MRACDGRLACAMGAREAGTMSSNAGELRKEAIRLLDLADTSANPTMRDAFIRLALLYAELALKSEKAKGEKSPSPC